MKHLAFSLFTLLYLPFASTAQIDSLLKVTIPNGDVIYVCPVVHNIPTEWGVPGKDIIALKNITSETAANMDFAGEANTAAIVAQLGTNGGTIYAAKVCADLVVFGFDDWYLPAAGELNEVAKLLSPNPMEPIEDIYWSSSEYDDYEAWFNSIFSLHGYKNGNAQCRCVRK